MKRILTVLLLLIVFGCGFAMAENTILNISGTGVVRVLADQVVVTLGVTETNEDVKVAQDTVNEKINAICDALLAAGVEEKNIGTNQISIYAQYSDSYLSGSSKLTGYTASNTITIQSTDLDQVGNYIDIAFEAGANTLDSVDFSASNTEQAKQEALRLAIQNAKTKADTIADALNMEVANVVQVDESQSYSYGNSGASVFNMREKSTDSATVVRAATLDVQASVDIQFELAEK